MGMDALGAWAGCIAWDGSIIGFWGYYRSHELMRQEFTAINFHA